MKHSVTLRLTAVTLFSGLFLAHLLCKPRVVSRAQGTAPVAGACAELPLPSAVGVAEFERRLSSVGRHKSPARHGG